MIGGRIPSTALGRGPRGCVLGARRMSALASYRGSLRVAADGPEHPRIAEAAAEHIRERLLNLLVGGARVLVEEGCGGEHHAAQAKAALRGLLVDEGLLDRMWLLSCAESFERRDLGFRNR